MSTRPEPFGSLKAHLSALTGRPAVSAQAASGTAIATTPAMKMLTAKLTNGTSIPISPKSTAFRISSFSSLNRSTQCRAASDIASARPPFPTISPTTTMASGPEKCHRLPARSHS